LTQVTELATYFLFYKWICDDNEQVYHGNMNELIIYKPNNGKESDSKFTQQPSMQEQHLVIKTKD